MIDISQGDLQELLAEVRQSIPCTCNSDDWEPEPSTLHTWNCAVHLEVLKKINQQPKRMLEL